MWTFFCQKITSNKIQVDQREFLALQNNVIFLTQKTMAYHTYVEVNLVVSSTVLV
jgi:hypothetical protein